MANQIASFNVPTEYDLQRSKIDRAQRMAEMLMQQSQAPAEQFSYGGYTAPTSPITGVSKIIQGLMSQYQSGKIEDRIKQNYEENARKPAEAFMNEIRGPLVPGGPGEAGYAPAERVDIEDQEYMVGKPGGPVAPMEMGALMPTAGGIGYGGNAATPDSYRTPSAEQAQQLYIKAMTGGFGPIAGQVAPTLFAANEASKRAKEAADTRAAELDLARKASEEQKRLDRDLREAALKQGSEDRLAAIESRKDIARDNLALRQQIQDNKPLPPVPQNATNQYNTANGNLDKSTDLYNRLSGSYKEMIDGKLIFNPLQNTTDFIKNNTNFSDEQSRAKAAFLNNMRGMANDILIAAKGTQTEGDAQRALNLILSGTLDQGVAEQQILKLLDGLKISSKISVDSLNKLGTTYKGLGHDKMDYPEYGDLPVRPNALVTPRRPGTIPKAVVGDPALAAELKRRGLTP